MIRDARVLVTGERGLVGAAVVKCLEAGGASVDAVPGIDLARNAWPRGPFDAIVHCAARLPMRFEGPEADAASAENRMMDDRALEAASGTHIVYFSTASVYGDTTGTIDESTPPAPRLGYAREKLATERAIERSGTSSTIFRLVAPYGPRQTRPTVLLRYIDAALAGNPLRYYGTGSRTQDFLHVDDVADAVSLAITRKERGLFVLASGIPISMRKLAELVVEATGSKSAVEAAGVPDPEESRLVTYRVDRLRERLGFSASRSLAEGIAAWAAARRVA